MPQSENIPNDILIIGAGVLGLCTAVELTRRGPDVRVVDTGVPNASSVAAGMVAPTLEAVMDRVTPERAMLMRDARSVWDGFAKGVGIAIHPARTFWAGRQTTAMNKAIEDLEIQPASVTADGRVSVMSDVLIEPGPALAAMRAVLSRPVISAWVGAVERTAGGWKVATAQGEIEARTLVLATGASRPVTGLPPEVARLIARIQPIRGQIGSVPDRTDAVLRGLGIYVAPSGEGALIGATMEPGRRDLEPDAAAGRQLIEAAEQLLGRPVAGPVEWRVGIRGATPDGLPMAGASGERGLYLALAPRRNGWLLGPLVARVVADAIEGEIQDGGAGSPHAAALDPRRFLTR